MEFAKPSLKWKKKIIPHTTLIWSGTDTQASRSIEFEIPWNPYDKEFTKWNIKKGDVIELWFNGSDEAWLVGTVTSREKTDEIGTARYVVKDYMHHLLQSTGTYIFKNVTPEAITKKVCGDAGIPVGNLFKTGVKIKKMIFEGACLYDIIIKAYRKVKAETKKNYIPFMLGNKLIVLEKGNDCAAQLTQGVNITSASYSDNVDNMVDLVRIYNDKHKEIGTVKNDKHLSTYGVYQQTYQKEDGVSATKAAKAMLYGTTREASVEALGDIRAISGFSIKIKDPATGLTGKFYITSDTHTFENNTHTMSLNLAWKDTMEEGAELWKKQEQENQEAGGSGYGGGGGYGGSGAGVASYTTYNDSTWVKMQQEQANKQFAYYVDAVSGYGYMGQPVYAQTCYHSAIDCKILVQEKKKYNTGTAYSKQIAEIKKMRRVIQAPSTVGIALKPCSCCWKTGEFGELVSTRTAKIQGAYSAASNQGTTKPGVNTNKDPRYRYSETYWDSQGNIHHG